MSTQPRTARQVRINTIRATIAALEDELVHLEIAEAPTRVRKRRGIKQPCGTEEAYQQHAHYRDTATEKRRVTCGPCLKAHAEHERRGAAIRRHMARMDELDRQREAS